MAELPHLGTHCFLKDCNQLDFLPFECQFCRKIFCLEHRTPPSHSCSDVPDSILLELPPETDNPLFNECRYENCFKGEIFPVLCPKCGQNYCLEHRHPDDHYCEGLQREEEMEESLFLEKQLEIDKALNEFKKRNTATSAPICDKPQGRKSEEMAAKVERMRMKLESGNYHEPDDISPEESELKRQAEKTNTIVKEPVPQPLSIPPVKPPRKKSKDIAMNVKLMKMKMKAVGPPSTLENDKVFFEVRLPKEAKKTETIIYFKKSWSVGKSVDWLTDHEKLTNKNNVPNAQKIQLFWSESALPLSCTWNELLMSKKELISGETLSLEYST